MKESNVVKSGGNLKDYSPWLSSFQTRNETYQLEIPGRSGFILGLVEYCCMILIHFFYSGQYSGRSKPLPEYHVKIAGFDEKVRKSLLRSARFID